ncbi:MAG: amidase [Gemmatimonadetes bacterium]|nr:amidase [Gemmatimonadota bacterium]
MNPTGDVASLPAHEQARRIREGELRAAELLEACIARVERHNEAVNAIVTSNPEAYAEAAAVDEKLARGVDAGPLAGLVVGIKDVTETAGLRTTYGSKRFELHEPTEDALVVRRFREAGAVILGKTNTPEFAAGGSTWNDVFGATRNPWDLARSPGGSTGGGAAALATGMISLAHGTDLGGSLRIPASFCGVVGLRPSVGLIPTVPSAYLWDDLQATGVMARSAADVGLALSALAAPADEAPVTAPPRWSCGEAPVAESDLFQRTLAYCRDIAGIGIDPDVADVCDEAVDRLRGRGVRVDEIDLDLSYGRDAFIALRGYWFVAQLHHELDRVDDYGPNVSANLKSGLEVTARELGAAEGVRRAMREQFHGLFERYAAVLTPCMAIPPFGAEENYPRTIAGVEMKTYIDWVAPTFLLSLPGLPVAAVPAGLDPAGLPVGLQVVVPAFDEPRALALAGAVQAQCPIGHPPLVSPT